MNKRGEESTKAAAERIGYFASVMTGWAGLKVSIQAEARQNNAVGAQSVGRGVSRDAVLFMILVTEPLWG